jgi:hypothetical protein
MNTQKIALYVILGLLSLNFVPAGIMAALLMDPFKANLTVMHYAPAFMVFLGLVEALCGIGIWFPRFRNLALLTLLLIMAGAIGSHIANGQPLVSIAFAVGVSACILVAAWLSNGPALGRFLAGHLTT